MAIFQILKTLAPLVASAGRMVAGLRADTAAKVDDRMSRVEQQTVRVGEILTGLAEQLQAVAEQTAAAQKQIRALLVVSALAFCSGVGALLIVWLRE